MSPGALAAMLRANIIDDDLPQPSWNIAPTQTVPIVVGSPPERHVAPARWSLVPPWAKELKLAFPTFNARIETALEKPTFRASVISKRCIVPFDGYYEWQALGGVKTPRYVHRRDAQPMFLAGLYAWWREPEAGAWHLTATILTRDAVGVMKELHDRMPVVVHPDVVDDWLDKNVPGDASLLHTVSDSGLALLPELQIDTVRPLRGDSAELIQPVSP